jgi:hypothetical protein
VSTTPTELRTDQETIMEQLMRSMVMRASKKPLRRDYDVQSLVSNEYDRYLASYHPRKPKQKRKATKQQPIGPFETMVPYTITLIGYLAGGMDINALYVALEARLCAPDDKTPGSIDARVSSHGTVQRSGCAEEPTKAYLPNHTSVGMWLSGGLRVILRVSTSKFEVIGCKRDEDVLEVWRHVKAHLAAMPEVRSQPGMPLELVRTYGAMRNYSFNVGYQLDVSVLAAYISERSGAGEIEFTARRNPSVQTNLHVGHPYRGSPLDAGAGGGPGHAYAIVSGGPSDVEVAKLDEHPKTTPKRKKRSDGESQLKEHIFSVFHTGNCLYSGKGDLEECRRVYEKFRALVAEARSSVEVCHAPSPLLAPTPTPTAV